MKKRKENTCLESRLRYQEIYIRYLENELIKRMSNVEKEEHMRFDYECERTPILYQFAYSALEDDNNFLSKKLEKILGKITPIIDILEIPDQDFFPTSYILPRIAYMNLYEDQIHPGNYQVILKCLNGKDAFGYAMYLSSSEKLTHDRIGYLIEKFFYDILPLKFKNLEKK